MYKYKLSNSDLVTITSGGASVRSRLRASLRRTALSRDKDGSKHSKPPLLEPPKVHFHFHTSRTTKGRLPLPLSWFMLNSSRPGGNNKASTCLRRRRQPESFMFGPNFTRTHAGGRRGLDKLMSVWLLFQVLNHKHRKNYECCPGSLIIAKKLTYLSDGTVGHLTVVPSDK